MVKQGKSHTVQWIKLMMIISQLLLILFTGNWLYSQYQKEKDQLTKDVHITLSDVNREVSDSILFKKLVAPTLQKNESSTSESKLSYKNLQPHTVNTTFKISLNTNLDSHAGIIQKHDSWKILPGNKSVIIASNNNIPVHSASDSNDGIIKQLLPLLLKEMGGMTYNIKINSDSILRPDSMLLRNNFNKKAKLNNWNFEAVWVYDTNKGNPKKGLVVSSTYLDHNASILLKDYKWGLIKKISPQIIFVFILLLLTGSSFAFAYRSLKKQMQLTAIKNDFISNMSHELKTPISTVKIALEALDNFNVIEDSKTTRDYIKMAGIEMNRLDMLVNKTLNASMLEEGRIVLQKEQLDVKQLTEDTLALLRYRFTQQGAEISTDFEEGNYVTAIDKMHIQGVIINIIDNSLKYNNKPPHIIISAKVAANNITIAIADNGPGIKEEYQKRVFDKFFRVPAGDTHDVKGYGLGLSYARQIITLHGGSIDVKNRAEGGCIFTINLPKA